MITYLLIAFALQISWSGIPITPQKEIIFKFLQPPQFQIQNDITVSSIIVERKFRGVIALNKGQLVIEVACLVIVDDDLVGLERNQ